MQLATNNVTRSGKHIRSPAALTLTTNNVQGAERDVGEQVERLAAHLHRQFSGQDCALLIENVDEIVQDFEVEGRCEDLWCRLNLNNHTIQL